MSIQEISVSNNQKKQLIKSINDGRVLVVDEHGDVVVSVPAYREYCEIFEDKVIETILKDAKLNYTVEFFVFS